MSKVWKYGCAVLVLVALVATAQAEIYTVGHLEQDNGTRSYLETWTDDLSARLDIIDVGPAHDPLFGSPHDAFVRGDIDASNLGDEFVLGRSDGFGVVIKLDGSSPRIGDALFFRQGGISHVEATGFQTMAVIDAVRTNPGNEIVTFAHDGVLEIWDYDETLGVQNARLHLGIFTSISAGENPPPDGGDPYGGYDKSSPAFEQVAIGDYTQANYGYEIALLRSDGLVEIWDIVQEGAWPATSADRLGIFDIENLSLHLPWDHMFAGDLDPNEPADALATLGSDGWVETYHVGGQAKITSLGNLYTLSLHEPFLHVTADGIGELLGPAFCGDEGTIDLAGDVNGDGRVDLADFGIMADGWLECTDPNDSYCDQFWK